MTYDDAIAVIDRVMAARADCYPDEPAARDAIRHKVAQAVSTLRTDDEGDCQFLLFDMLLMMEHRHTIWREHQAA